MSEEIKKVDTSKIKVTISENELQAFLCVLPPEKDEEYKLDQLLQALIQAGVIYGLKREAVQEILTSGTYGENVCVAQGTLPEEGTNGYFEYLFETKLDSRPRILKDGSVDYTTYGIMQLVEKDEKLAIYHKAVQGKDGMSVKGVRTLAKPTRDLAKIRGRNVTVSEDGTLYTAAVAGRISYDANIPNLSIVEVLEIPEDVSVNTGDISFPGDIYVKGNIHTDMTVTSHKGSITVDGHVEGATLVAKKDIVLKSGMQGNGKGKIACSGSVSGKFFEQAVVDAQGSVNANSIMHCVINAGEDIIVSGRLGIIIGGHINAMRRIEATIIGNMAEVHTDIMAGIEGDLFAMLSQTEKQMQEMEAEVGKLLEGIAKIDTILKTDPDSKKAAEFQKNKVELVRAKVERDARINEIVKKREDILIKMEKANNAKVVIQKGIFPGTKITINGVSVNVKEAYMHVEYSRRGAGIIVNNIGE